MNLIGDSGQSEVGDHHLTASIEHDVRGFQVAVKHALGVCGGQSGAELASNVEGFVFGQAADAPQQRGQIFPIHIFHGEEGVTFNPAYVVDAANVGMRNAPSDPHFILETLE